MPIPVGGTSKDGELEALMPKAADSKPATAGQGSVSGNQPAPSSGKVPPAPPVKPASSQAEGDSYGGGLRVSLIPSGEEDASAVSNRKRIAIVMAIILVELVGIGVTYWVMNGKVVAKRAEAEEILQQVRQTAKKIQDIQPELEEVGKFDAKLKVASKVLDLQRRWVSIYQILQSVTKPEVNYNNFAGDVLSRTIYMEANAPDYRAAAEQIVALREHPMVESVACSSAEQDVKETGEVGMVTFSLAVQFKAEAWHMAETVLGETEGTAQGEVQLMNSAASVAQPEANP